MGSVARADTPIRLKVVYKTPHNLLAEFTRSLGRGEVTIPSRKSVPVGTRFIFELRTQGSKDPVEVLGNVLRVTESLPGQYLLHIRYQAPENRPGLDALLKVFLDSHRYEKVRKHPRLPLFLKVGEATRTASSVEYVVRDISRGGLGMEILASKPPSHLTAGTPFLLELHLDLGHLALHGEIAWLSTGSKFAGVKTLLPSFGVAFGKLRPASAALLEKLLVLSTLPPPPWKAEVSFGMDAISRMP